MTFWDFADKHADSIGALAFAAIVGATIVGIMRFWR